MYKGIFFKHRCSSSTFLTQTSWTRSRDYALSPTPHPSQPPGHWETHLFSPLHVLGETMLSLSFGFKWHALCTPGGSAEASWRRKIFTTIGTGFKSCFYPSPLLQFVQVTDSLLALVSSSASHLSHEVVVGLNGLIHGHAENTECLACS